MLIQSVSEMAERCEALADATELTDQLNLVCFTGQKCQPFDEQAATLHFTDNQSQAHKVTLSQDCKSDNLFLPADI